MPTWGKVRDFKAWADDDTEYTISEEAYIIETVDHLTGRQVGPGKRREFKTPEGYEVRPQPDGSYEVVTPSGPVIVRTK
jgi:hypothetical protein